MNYTFFELNHELNYILAALVIPVVYTLIFSCETKFTWLLFTGMNYEMSVFKLTKLFMKQYMRDGFSGMNYERRPKRGETVI